jgi:hypothetical protein
MTLEMDLWRVRPDGRESERLTWGKLDVRYPTPIDESTLLYCARDADGAGPWLWALDVETKTSCRAVRIVTRQPRDSGREVVDQRDGSGFRPASHTNIGLVRFSRPDSGSGLVV